MIISDVIDRAKSRLSAYIEQSEASLHGILIDSN